jgi:hypothetical protein
MLTLANLGHFVTALATLLRRYVVDIVTILNLPNITSGDMARATNLDFRRKCDDHREIVTISTKKKYCCQND